MSTKTVGIDATLPAPSIGTALDGGLGYYDLVNRNAYTYVQVGPIPKANRGDTVTVIWAGSKVVFYAIKDTDLGKVFNIPVLNARIADAGDGDRVLGYSVTYHQGGGQEFSDPPVHIKVKRTIPGDLDPFPDTPYNENLALADVRPNPVPPDATEVTIGVPLWKNPAPGDQLVVSWNGAMFFALPLPDVSYPETVSVTLTAQDVLDAGIGEGVPVTSCIYDTVANWSGWAETVAVNVRVEDPGQLLAPRVGDKDIGWTQIKLVELGSKDLDVFTPVYEGAENGDIVIVHARGTALDGSKVIFDSDPQTTSEPGFGLTFKIPNATVQKLTGGEVRVWYTVTGKDNSHSVWLPVIGVVQGDFPVPLVVEAVDTDGNGLADWLDPDKADPAHVTIAYPTMARGDLVTLTLEGTGADGAPVKLSYPQPLIDILAPITVTVPLSDILKFLNGQVDVYYSVSPYSRRPTFIRALGEMESEHLTLRVRLANAAEPHPVPALKNDRGEVISENGFFGSATLYVDAQARYRYPAIGDEIIYSWVGPVSTQTRSYRVRDPAALPSDRADRGFTDNNKGGKVVVSYSVKRGGLDPADPAEPSATLTFWISFATEDFQAVDLAYIEPNTPLDLGSMTIRTDKGFRIFNVNLGFPATDNRILMLTGHVYVAIEFPRWPREVSFDFWAAAIEGTVDIDAWDPWGGLISKQTLAADYVMRRVVFSSSSERPIWKITHTSGNTRSEFDNFTLIE